MMQYLMKLLKMQNKATREKTEKRLQKKVKNLDKKIPDATTLIYINQYNNTNKQNLEKKMGSLIKNTGCKWFSDYKCFKYKNQ